MEVLILHVLALKASMSANDENRSSVLGDFAEIGCRSNSQVLSYQHNHPQ